MDLKERLEEALQWHVDNHTITADKESIVVVDEGSELSVKFGSHEVDGYRVMMYIFRNGEIDRIIVSGEGDIIEDREQETLEGFLQMDGTFNTFLLDSLGKLEIKMERNISAQRAPKSGISTDPLA